MTDTPDRDDEPEIVCYIKARARSTGVTWLFLEGATMTRQQADALVEKHKSIQDIDYEIVEMKN